jgi:hypothetical protein
MPFAAGANFINSITFLYEIVERRETERERERERERETETERKRERGDRKEKARQFRAASVVELTGIKKHCEFLGVNSD